MNLIHKTPLTINGIDELKAHAGDDLGVSSWHDSLRPRSMRSPS